MAGDREGGSSGTEEDDEVAEFLRHLRRRLPGTGLGGERHHFATRNTDFDDLDPEPAPRRADLPPIVGRFLDATSESVPRARFGSGRGTGTSPTPPFVPLDPVDDPRRRPRVRPWRRHRLPPDDEDPTDVDL